MPGPSTEVVLLGNHECKLKDRIQALNHPGDFLVTRFVRQHPYAAELFPRTTNSLRVLTIWDYEQGEPFVAGVVQKIGTSRSFPADNWRGGRGGLNAAVDRETGALGPGAMLPNTWCSRHPETGSVIEGVVVPNWHEMEASLRGGARLLHFAPQLAWDVVVTENGFSVLEINGAPGLLINQVLGPLLADPRARAFYGFHGIV